MGHTLPAVGEVNGVEVGAGRSRAPFNLIRPFGIGHLRQQDASVSVQALLWHAAHSHWQHEAGEQWEQPRNGRLVVFARCLSLGWFAWWVRLQDSKGVVGCSCGRGEMWTMQGAQVRDVASLVNNELGDRFFSADRTSNSCEGGSDQQQP